MNNVKFNMPGDEIVRYARAEIVSLGEEALRVGVETAHDWGQRVVSHAIHMPQNR